MSTAGCAHGCIGDDRGRAHVFRVRAHVFRARAHVVLMSILIIIEMSCSDLLQPPVERNRQNICMYVYVLFRLISAVCRRKQTNRVCVCMSVCSAQRQHGISSQSRERCVSVHVQRVRCVSALIDIVTLNSRGVREKISLYAHRSINHVGKSWQSSTIEYALIVCIVGSS